MIRIVKILPFAKRNKVQKHKKRSEVYRDNERKKNYGHYLYCNSF